MRRAGPPQGTKAPALEVTQPFAVKALTRQRWARSPWMPVQVNSDTLGLRAPAPMKVPGAKPLSRRVRSSHCSLAPGIGVQANLTLAVPEAEQVVLGKLRVAPLAAAAAALDAA